MAEPGEPGEAPADRFEEGWLGLREGVDHRSRAEALVAPLRAAWRDRGWSRVVDLGAGTGSNLRYLSPRLPPSQRWTLVDHDPALLARARDGLPASDRAHGAVPEVEIRVGDLDEVGLAAVDDADLVTASALLDLVSRRWLERLVDRVVDAGAGLLVALSYDGTVGWDAPLPDDDLVREAVNRHQRRDKGLGGALGPDAAVEAARLLEAAGRTVRLEPSPWRLGPGDEALTRELVDGWARAAAEERPDAAARIAAWAAERTARAGEGVRVGHQDLLALP